MRDPDKVFDIVRSRAEQHELQRVKRNNRLLSVVLVIVIVAVIGTSIMNHQRRSEKKKQNADNVETVVTPTATVAATPTKTAKPTVTMSPTPTQRPIGEYDSNIVWAVLITSWITEEARVQIQQMLDQKGLNCHIEFVEVQDSGKDYAEWLNGRKNTKKAPDIISSGAWENGIIDAAAFAEAEMLPLNDYLATEEGKALWDSFAEAEWDRTEFRGKYYTIPNRSQRMGGLNEWYMYVNDRYKEAFDESFDGTYESLRKICGADTGSPRVIATRGFGSSLLMAFMGYQNLFGASYDPQTQKVDVLTNQSETKELLQMIYMDYRNGLLNKLGYEEALEKLPDNTLVYITNDESESLEGYTKVVWVQDPCNTTIGGAYGVSATSTRKELALQVLAACYSDPEIASLLCWREADAERWTERTAYMNSLTARSTTGFFPEISTGQYAVLRKYADDLSNLCSKMSLNIQGSSKLNTAYLDYLESFFSTPKDYGDTFDVMNEQLEAWHKDKASAEHEGNGS